MGRNTNQDIAHLVKAVSEIVAISVARSLARHDDDLKSISNGDNNTYMQTAVCLYTEYQAIFEHIIDRIVFSMHGATIRDSFMDELTRRDTKVFLMAYYKEDAWDSIYTEVYSELMQLNELYSRCSMIIGPQEDMLSEDALSVQATYRISGVIFGSEDHDTLALTLQTATIIVEFNTSLKEAGINKLLSGLAY
jgi:hypothetical protein